MVLAAVASLCSIASPLHNLNLCTSVIRRAAAAGARVVWLPEASDFIADAKDVSALARPLLESAFVDGIQVGLERRLLVWRG